jgi:hypothetical protein
MKHLCCLLLLALSCASVVAAPRVSVTTDTNGVLVAPIGFFQANSQYIQEMIDTAVGLASTNAVWPKAGQGTTAETNGYTVTINADVTLQVATNIAKAAAEVATNGLGTAAQVTAASNVVHSALIASNALLQAQIAASTNNAATIGLINTASNQLSAALVATNSLLLSQIFATTNGMATKEAITNSILALTDSPTNFILNTAGYPTNSGAYVTNGGTANVTSTNTTHLGNAPASAFSQRTNDSWGVVRISYQSGAFTNFFPANDSDLARGAALSNAVVAAGENARIAIGKGTYELNWNLIMKQGQSLVGAGKYETIIKSTNGWDTDTSLANANALPQLIVPADNCFIGHLTGDSRPAPSNLFSMAIGWCITNTAGTNVKVQNCAFYGESDVLYLSTSNKFEIALEDCLLDASWDISVGGGSTVPGSTTAASRATLRRCQAYISRTNSLTGANPLRAFQSFNVDYVLEDCVIVIDAISGQVDTALHLWDNDTRQGSFTVRNTILHVEGSSGLELRNGMSPFNVPGDGRFMTLQNVNRLDGRIRGYSTGYAMLVGPYGTNFCQTTRLRTSTLLGNNLTNTLAGVTVVGHGTGALTISDAGFLTIPGGAITNGNTVWFDRTNTPPPSTTHKVWLATDTNAPTTIFVGNNGAWTAK